MNYVIAAVLAILYTVGSIAIGYHFGEQHVVVKDDAAAIKQETANDAKRITDQATVAQEAKTYETATDPSLTPVVGPSVSVCYYKAVTVVPSPHTPGPRNDDPPQSGAGDTPVPTVTQWDTSPVLRIAHDADAQIKSLQDYITHVCLVEK